VIIGIDGDAHDVMGKLEISVVGSPGLKARATTDEALPGLTSVQAEVGFHCRPSSALEGLRQS
jgi:hypothetical protein